MSQSSNLLPCCGTRILPYLYLGAESDAANVYGLKSHNIYYVLNVTADLPGEGEKASIRYKRIPVRDSFDANLAQYFEESFKFIEEARRSGRAVLIHCHAGISRSPTIVVAYLMYSRNMTFNNAYKFVEARRPIISPNFSFVGQLFEYGRSQLRKVSPASTPVTTTSTLNASSPVTGTPLTPSTPTTTTASATAAAAAAAATATFITITLSQPQRRKSCNSDFILLRPIKMTKNTRVK